LVVVLEEDGGPGVGVVDYGLCAGDGGFELREGPGAGRGLEFVGALAYVDDVLEVSLEGVVWERFYRNGIIKVVVLRVV
jgi:hypothetical protein